MREKKLLLPTILGVLSLASMTYNFWAFVTLRKLLVPSLLEITPYIDRISIGIIIAYFLTALFHLFLLRYSLKLISKVKKIYFLTAVFFVGVILSGILILSDAALLSDLGKEYLYWDVTQEWNILFGLSFIHTCITLVGLGLIHWGPNLQNSIIFKQIADRNEGVFIITNQIGLICGLLGFTTLFYPDILGVAERFRASYIIVLSILTIAPFAASLTYWLIRNQKTDLKTLLDEKQFIDVAFGGLISMMLNFLIIVVLIILSRIQIINLNNPIYALFLIFSMIIALSATVLIRFR